MQPITEESRNLNLPVSPPPTSQSDALPADAGAGSAPAGRHAEHSVRRAGDGTIVETIKLTKRFGTFDALVDCSLQVSRGEVFGLLGPNGAGKTTLIRSMLGFLQPTSGHCVIAGHDNRHSSVRLREQVAYLPGDARVPRHMRGAGVLRFFAEMHPVGDLARSREVAERLELDTRRRVGSMSTGMRQKLALSVVLGLQTPVIILDEPTANLDPTIRAEVLKLVVEARQAGRTVLLSSHVLGEIEDTCQRVVFLRRGHLVKELAMADLFQRHRITAGPPIGGGARGNAVESASPTPKIQIEVPEPWRTQVQCETVREEGRTRIRIETAGDLAPLLPWLDSLNLTNLRIEPLGLRAVYDSVHHGEDTPGSEDEL
ncbi:MAG: ABC transporter ATP-binding protein [Rubripirellula sp.]|nr:ABC transporter ATP-binding protein [Rubripirellula sp.]